MIPKDPMMLLSYVNTQLRDHFSSLEELCASLDLDKEELLAKLSAVQYTYDQGQNRFI
ncbi:MAG: DUF4250 domain-containing protein [Lachnospiraceae bacterium]|nr:DUF4250 domain-containing protein [Lachnospiraceae bacterium]